MNLNEYYPRIFNKVCYETNNSIDAEDITQEVFEAAVRNWGSFRGESTILTWLFGIARYKLADYYKKSARKVPAPTNLTSENESDLVMLDIIERLPSQYQEIIRLEFIQGMAICEIAEKVSLHYEAVRSTRRRAFAYMRDNLLAPTNRGKQ